MMKGIIQPMIHTFSKSVVILTSLTQIRIIRVNPKFRVNEFGVGIDNIISTFAFFFLDNLYSGI